MSCFAYLPDPGLNFFGKINGQKMDLRLKFAFMSAVTLILMPRITTNKHQRFEWTSLKLRFDMFTSFPTTERDALQTGYTKISECESNTNFRGKQFMKNGDPQVILLFDVNGNIAGLQSGIPFDIDNGYPPDNMQPPFIRDGELYKLTAYFTDPSTICKRGRSQQRIQLHGIAEYLLIQNGTEPEEDVIEMALEESRTTWVKGLCFPGMGFHYFYNIYLDMNCSNFFPVALLYYHGQLKGFVWSYGAVLNSTVIPYEYPEPSFFTKLMEEVPLCLGNLRRSTLHVYFEENPSKYDCVNFEKRSECNASTADMLKVSTLVCVLWTLTFTLFRN